MAIFFIHKICKSSNVPDVGTFYDIWSNLGQLSQHKFKICTLISTEIWIPKFMPLHYSMGLFQIIFKISVKFMS
jgi:hypothetical protein